ncbi:T9SS type A sorting domain-containing protein [Algibacter mikhailovii]|uniref:T9SS type A sorting domain-containing protein n=1 Tax=Algibacter mikhailovii TaxID=425498 RepID=UPI0024956CCE|nr:T9SS type A sorting domain-containing protein [Algibacter mikhailovii]
MKKSTFKSIWYFSFLLFSFLLHAQTAPDEDTNPSIACSDEFRNPVRTAPDLPNPANVGTIDDRTCYSDYSESFVYDKTWGVYNITNNSNHFGGTLQPRMERSLSRSQETGVGSYAQFKGTFRILEVGDANSFSQDGTYIAQAKGKHTGGGGSPDPAICLYLAKPIYGSGANAGKQVSFNIYAERILYRGGEGSGREIVFLKNVLKDVETTFELEVGFKQDPNDASKKIHYCDAIIGGDAFNWNIPEPEKGTESGIRYGAYRVKGGRAQIRWANTTYQKVEVPDNGGTVPSDDIYRLRNVATGKFLTAVGSSATPVTMTDSGEPTNTHWTFVENGSYFNIDSETVGILRAVGSDPFLAVTTAKAPPAADTDKTWTIQYNESDETYRFESRFGGFLYHEIDDKVYHKKNVLETDPRSIWEAIPTSESLSVSNKELFKASINVYPNPAKDDFSVTFANMPGEKNIEIYSVLGKLVYKQSTNSNVLNISRNNLLTSGIYIIKAKTNDNKVSQTKLVIR